MQNSKLIAQLFNGYLDRTNTPEETSQLFLLLEDDNHNAILTSLIDETLANENGSFIQQQESVNEILGYITRQTSDVPAASYSQVSIHHIHFLKTTWFRYAAAIIIMVTGVAIWYAQHNHSKSFNPLNPSSRQIAAIPPGRDRAILTLANGQQIILDSTQGDIVKQGSLTVVNLAGKLKYEGVGTNADYNTISTPKGGQYQIVLPDGSKVWLNAASSIKFPTAFTSNERKVEMTGEAYMEIARNAKQSFTVAANGAEIQVLGTSFNVNAYEDESAVKTTLIDGSVKVISGDQQSKTVILKPGQQAVVSSGRQLKIVDNADIKQALAWKNGRFQFNDANLAEIMRQLARWYDVEVVYDNGVPDIKLNGDMKRDLTLSQILEFLNEFGVKFRMEGKRLIVM